MARLPPPVSTRPSAPIHSELRPSASRHVALALTQLPGPLHAIEPAPYLRLCCNVGPRFAFAVAGSGTTFVCERQALLLVPPGLDLLCEARTPMPAGRAYKPARLATLHLSRELLADSAMSLGLPPAPARLQHQVLPDDAVLRLTTQALIADLDTGQRDGVQATERLAQALLGRLLLRLQARSGDLAPPGLARVREHIERHLHEPLTLADLAAVASMSPFHFCRMFRATMGETPHQYLLARRIEQAQRLLRNGGAPAPSVLDVALACGFNSPSHFAAQFRRRTGQTPRQWQRAHGAR